MAVIALVFDLVVALAAPLGVYFIGLALSSNLQSNNSRYGSYNASIYENIMLWVSLSIFVGICTFYWFFQRVLEFAIIYNH